MTLEVVGLITPALGSRVKDCTMGSQINSNYHYLRDQTITLTKRSKNTKKIETKPERES